MEIEVPSEPTRNELLEEAFEAFKALTIALERAEEADELPEWIESYRVAAARRLVDRVEAA